MFLHSKQCIFGVYLECIFGVCFWLTSGSGSGREGANRVIFKGQQASSTVTYIIYIYQQQSYLRPYITYMQIRTRELRFTALCSTEAVPEAALLPPEAHASLQMEWAWHWQRLVASALAPVVL